MITKAFLRATIFLLAGLVIGLGITAPAQAEGPHCGATHITDRDRHALLRAKFFDHGEQGERREPEFVWESFCKYKKFGASARPEIEKLLAKATPPGRLYAVILLQQFDPKAATKILKTMKDDTTPIDYFRGCKGMHTTVGALATQLLKGEVIVKMEDEQKSHR